MLATFFMLSVIPAQLKAATESNPVAGTATSDIKSAESNANANRLSAIKSIDMPAINSTENKELLKEVSPLKNDQDEHSRRYRNRHQQRDVDVTIRGDRGRGYGHGGAYIGAGGVLILILILVLVL